MWMCVFVCMCACFQVIIGGGRKYMTPKGTNDPEYPRDFASRGKRQDGRNLISEWQSLKMGKVALLLHTDEENNRIHSNSFKKKPAKLPKCWYLEGGNVWNHYSPKSKRSLTSCWLKKGKQQALIIWQEREKRLFKWTQHLQLSCFHQRPPDLKVVLHSLMITDKMKCNDSISGLDSTFQLLTAGQLFECRGYYPSKDNFTLFMLSCCCHWLCGLFTLLLHPAAPILLVELSSRERLNTIPGTWKTHNVCSCVKSQTTRQFRRPVI